jgi:hypothetical protein
MASLNTEELEEALDRLARLARRKREEEEKEKGLGIGRRKVRDTASSRKSLRGRARFDEPPKFSAPSPLLPRPRITSGPMTFHFDYVSISKSVLLAKNGRTFGGQVRYSSQSAFDHAKYIEREGAAENLHELDQAVYIERAGAVTRVAGGRSQRRR